MGGAMALQVLEEHIPVASDP